MRRTVATLLCIPLLALPLAWPSAAQAQALPAPKPAAASHAASAPQPAMARVIVKYKADSPLVAKSVLSKSPLAESARRIGLAQALGRRIGIALAAGPAIAESTQVVTASGIASAQLAAQLAAQPDVEYAVPDERRHALGVPNDPYYASRGYDRPGAPAAGGPLVGQWYLKPPGAAGTAANTAPSAIDAQAAWDITAGNPGIVVAVLDTGVRFDHADLQGGNVLQGYDMISDAGIANNGGQARHAGAADPGDFITAAEANQAGGPFYGGSPDFCAPAELGNPGRYLAVNSSWHGTQTLGLIGAATGNGIGMASTGRTVTVLPVRVLGKCGGFDSDIIAGMRWAAGLGVPGVPNNPNPARVVNMSLGGAGSCSAYTDAVSQLNAQGVVVVAAAGNSTGHAVGAPAKCPGVIAVGGLRHLGTKVGFSDVGPEIALSAPGGNCVDENGPCLYPMLTTSNSGTTTPVTNANGGSIYTDSFNYSVGTSFSAPLVAGTAALMLSVQPGLSARQVMALLQSSARAFPTTGAGEGSNTPIPACVAPHTDAGGNPVDQLECYCTTSTCGAGMLDSRAAVFAASGEPPGDHGDDGGGGALDTVTLLGLLAALLALGASAVPTWRARARRQP